MDYNGTSEVVQFTTAGVQCVDIPINMDRVLEEEEEQFSVVLTTTDDAITIGRQSATVTIIDSDGMCCFLCVLSGVLFTIGATLKTATKCQTGCLLSFHVAFTRRGHHILQGAM